MMRQLVFGVLLVFLVACEVKCQGYGAVVWEYNPDIGDSAEDTVLRNVERYMRQIESAKDQGAAIVVFPEYGLTGFHNDVLDNLNAYSTALPAVGVAPSDYSSLGTNYSKALIDLSVSARQNGIYVVVNLIERAANSNNDSIYYNTNVVFDRNGAIVARYRKINLNNNEPGLTAGDEVVIFSTDFSATFGTFTGDDILFKKPARDVLNYENVTNIIYPTRWTVENPFLTPLGVQASYATANGLNLLAAGLSNVPNGTTGSGVYYHNGTSETRLSSVSTSLALYASIPILSVRTFPPCSQALPRGLIGGGQVPDISTQSFIREDLSNYTFSNINLSNNFTEEKVCSGPFCCEFSVSIQQAETAEYYKLAAFHGVQEYGKKTIGTRICSLLACASDNTDSCGYASQASTRFASIRITSNFADNTDVFDQPVTLLTDYKPLDSSLFSYCPQKVAENGTVTITFNTLGSVQGVRTFGIFGRVYNYDNLPTGVINSAPSMTAFNTISLLVLSYIVFLRE